MPNMAVMDLVIDGLDEKNGVSQSCPMRYQSDFPGFFDTPLGTRHLSGWSSGFGFISDLCTGPILEVN